LVAIAFTLLSCAQGNPVIPDQSEPQPVVQQQTVVPPAIDNHYLWGYYDFLVDPAKPSIEILPVRAAAGHWNVLKWLEKGPCTDCVSVVNINPTGTGTTEFTVKIDHPFDSPNVTGFDVRGIVMFSGSHAFPVSSLTTPDRTQGDGEIVNADGYTTLYYGATQGSGPNGLQGYMKGKFASLTVPDAKLNGYKRHVSTGFESRNIFLAGDSVSAVYELDMPDTQFIFGYAVDASWVPATVIPVTNPISDFPPSANCPEPWKIEVSETPIGTGLNTKGGSTKLTIDVYDWQGKDSHQAPIVECPELFSGTITASLIADLTSYSRWEITITNSEQADVGTYKCLMKVVDDDNASSPSWLDLSAYNLINLTVEEWFDVPPVPLASADPLLQIMGEPVHFSDEGSYDPDGGPITKYEWDFDYNGVYDDEGPTGSYIYPTYGTYYAQLRVTDDEGTMAILQDALEIRIHTLPVAQATPSVANTQVDDQVIFDASGSYDLDGGTIAKYEWDWNGDGNFVQETSCPGHVWTKEGIYYVNLRVTDDEGAINYLGTPLFVNVFGNGWARTWGGTGTEKALDVAVDSDNTTYVFGYYSGLVDFDPGVGEDEHTSNGGTDLFLSRYDSDGNLLWAVTWGGPQSDSAKGIALAANVSHVYLTGYFAGTVDFDPGPGVTEAVSNSSSLDAFLLCLDLDGNFQWVRAWGGTGSDEGMDVTDGGYGEAYVAGIFEDFVDFDPGTGETNLTSNGIFDCSLSKFDSEGEFQWARSWGGTGTDISRAIAKTHQGAEMNIVGSYSNAVDFDTGAGIDNRTSSGGTDAFITQIDSGGIWKWARVFGGTQDDEAYDIDTTSWDWLYVTGYFADSVNFNLNGGPPAVVSSKGAKDCFITSIDAEGWQEKFQVWGGPGDDLSLGAVYHYDFVTLFSYVFVTGYFAGSDITFPYEVGVHVLGSYGAEDMFLGRWSADSGYFDYCWWWGGMESDVGYGIGVNGYGNVYTVGAFMGTIDFDPGVGVDIHTSNGVEDAFLLKTTPNLTW
jgi:hypothetical protein